MSFGALWGILWILIQIVGLIIGFALVLAIVVALCGLAYAVLKGLQDYLNNEQED